MKRTTIVSWGENTPLNLPTLIREQDPYFNGRDVLLHRLEMIRDEHVSYVKVRLHFMICWKSGLVNLPGDTGSIMSETTRKLLALERVSGLTFLGNSVFQEHVKKMKFTLKNGENFCEGAIFMAKVINDNLIASPYSDMAPSWCATGRMVEEAFVYTQNHGLQSLFQVTFRKAEEKKKAVA